MANEQISHEDEHSADTQKGNSQSSIVPDAGTAKAKARNPQGYKSNAREFFKITYKWTRFTAHAWIKRHFPSPGAWTALATIVIALLTYAYVRYARKQWKAMNDQVTAMQAQLKEMQKQTMISRDELVGTKAAVLDVGIGLSDAGQLNVGLSNDGHVTATDIHFHLNASKNSVQDGTRIGSPLIFEPDVKPIQASRGLTWIWTLPWRPRQLGPEGYWPKGWPGTVTYTFWGNYSYQDGFGDTAQQWFCKQWLPRLSIASSKQGSAYSGGGLFDCTDMTTDIHSIRKQEEEAEAEQRAERTK